MNSGFNYTYKYLKSVLLQYK